jgi:cytochrome P450
MPKPVEKWAQIASVAVEDLIDEVSGAGAVDFATTFAEPLAGLFWQQVFDLTAEECDRALAALRAMAPLFFITRTPDEITAIETATADYQQVLATAVERSAVNGGNKLLASMKREFDSLGIEDRPQSFGFWVSTNVIDGFHTAAIACVNVLYALLRTPQALIEARDDGALLPGALAEGLRMLAPVMVSNRCALEDFEYAGRRIPEGTAISMLWAAANRDPAVFENPNRYDLRRAGRTPMTFGGGVHICPGRYVGSMLVFAALKGLVNRSVKIELVGAGPQWLDRSFMRWADRVTVTIRRVGSRQTPNQPG